jgi:hypothetical protein
MIEKKHAEKLKFSCAAMHNDGVLPGDRRNMCKGFKSAKSEHVIPRPLFSHVQAPSGSHGDDDSYRLRC